VWERRRPEWIRAAQDRAVAAYVSRVVYPYSPFHRERLDAAGLGGRGVRTRADLQRLRPIAIAALPDPRSLVLRPDERSIQRHGDFSLVRRVAWAKARGHQSAINREMIDPVYKPVHWLVQDGLFIGCSSEDLDRMADIGRRWLELAGVGRHDVALGLLPAGPHLPYWMFVLGCRRAGLSAIHLPPVPTPAQVAALAPAAVAGRPADLLLLFEAARDAGRTLSSVRTVLTAGTRLDDVTRERLRAALASTQAEVVAAWSPTGVRALWSECRGGDGLHTWPDSEVIDLIEPLTGVPARPGADGEVVWSALGWKGTALLRLATGVYGSLDESPCPRCGRSTPRLRLTADVPAFVTVLAAHPEVRDWMAELRTVDGEEELVVYLSPSGNGHPGRLLRELDAQLSVTQFVVLDAPALDARLAAHDGQRVVDLRPGP
jgi:hypothetical protein